VTCMRNEFSHSLDPELTLSALRSRRWARAGSHRGDKRAHGRVRTSSWFIVTAHVLFTLPFMVLARLAGLGAIERLHVSRITDDAASSTAVVDDLLHLCARPLGVPRAIGNK